MMQPNQQQITGGITRIVYFLAIIGLFTIFGIGVFVGAVVIGAV